MQGQYAQDVAVAEDGGEVVFEVFEGDELVAPSFDGVVVALECVVCAGEEVDDGGDGASGGGGGGSCVGGEAGECGVGERKETGEVFGVFFLVDDQVCEQPRIGSAVDHDDGACSRRSRHHIEAAQQPTL